jgi:hypothetical protein
MFALAILAGVLFGILFHYFIYNILVNNVPIVTKLGFLKGLLVFLQWVGSVGIVVLVGVKLGFYFFIDIPAADPSAKPAKPPQKGILKKLGNLTDRVLDSGWHLLFKPFFNVVLVDMGVKTTLMIVLNIPTTKTVNGKTTVEGSISQVIVQITYTVNGAEILSFANIGGHEKVVEYLKGVVDSFVRQAAANIGWADYYAGKDTLETGLKTKIMSANVIDPQGGQVRLGINVNNVIITHIEALKDLLDASLQIPIEEMQAKSFEIEQKSFQQGVDVLVKAEVNPDVAVRIVSVLQGKVPGDSVKTMAFDITGLTNIEGPLAALAASLASKFFSGGQGPQPGSVNQQPQTPQIPPKKRGGSGNSGQPIPRSRRSQQNP